MSQTNPYYNPYAEPEVAPNQVDLLGLSSEASIIRQNHISHEASVKSISLLYFIGATIFVILSLLLLGGLASQSQSASEVLLRLSLAGLAMGFGVMEGYAAWLIRRLQPLGRILGTVVAAFGLLGFPMGTLISAYILYLLWSRKGNVVFSEDYKTVIAQTPHIKYRTSIVVWVVFGLLVMLFAFVVAGAIASR